MIGSKLRAGIQVLLAQARSVKPSTPLIQLIRLLEQALIKARDLE